MNEGNFIIKNKLWVYLEYNIMDHKDLMKFGCTKEEGKKLLDGASRYNIDEDMTFD